MIEPVVLAARADISSYLGRWRWLLSGREIALDLSMADEARRHRLEVRLNFWRSVCGCQAGAFAFIAMTIWRIFFAGVPTWTGRAVAASAALVLLAAIVGKLLAILAARLVLLIELARLRRELSEERNLP
ncbi:MAG TPA: hypothetical protein VNA69_06125 [Thermoanaerobaculia bacterium]|nr:hypothetical protein [Thermoanaerobaculia bacterium]